MFILRQLYSRSFSTKASFWVGQSCGKLFTCWQLKHIPRAQSQNYTGSVHKIKEREASGNSDIHLGGQIDSIHMSFRPIHKQGLEFRFPIYNSVLCKPAMHTLFLPCGLSNIQLFISRKAVPARQTLNPEYLVTLFSGHFWKLQAHISVHALGREALETALSYTPEKLPTSTPYFYFQTMTCSCLLKASSILEDNPTNAGYSCSSKSNWVTSYEENSLRAKIGSQEWWETEEGYLSCPTVEKLFWKQFHPLNCCRSLPYTCTNCHCQKQN